MAAPPSYATASTTGMTTAAGNNWASGGASSSSEGSRLHHSGRCKPCAFFHTKGCQNGISCSFCHECPPNEAQRRKRVRRQLMKPYLGEARANNSTGKAHANPVQPPQPAESGQSGQPVQQLTVPTAMQSGASSHSRQSSEASSTGSGWCMQNYGNTPMPQGQFQYMLVQMPVPMPIHGHPNQQPQNPLMCNTMQPYFAKHSSDI